MRGRVSECSASGETGARNIGRIDEERSGLRQRIEGCLASGSRPPGTPLPHLTEIAPARHDDDIRSPNFAGLLFSLGIIGVGFLAVPVMTTGAAYDLCQSGGWRNGLSYKPKEAKIFYAAITLFTLAAMGINFIGINPMRALVFAGIVQDFSTPPLTLLIMLMTNRESIMGDKVNGRMINPFSAGARRR
jgi:Mn2+/Fe2+ NRAMP family transporter